MLIKLLQGINYIIFTEINRMTDEYNYDGETMENEEKYTISEMGDMLI